MNVLIDKLATILVKYSLDLQPDEECSITTNPAAHELNLAVYKKAVLAGAHLLVNNRIPGADEFFLKHAGEEQLDYVSPLWELIYTRFTADLYIDAPENTRAFSNIPLERKLRVRAARAPLKRIHRERTGRREAKWCYTVFPTNALAQEAGMSLSEYWEFFSKACWLHEEDPVAAWQEESRREQRLIARLQGHEDVVLKGENIDLRLSIRGRPFVESAGRENFPSGEIFTSPVEDSIEGWVRFSHPAIVRGHEVEGIELWFERGRVVKEHARQGIELLRQLLDTDPGARYIGEWGIGTNYAIQQFTKNFLFDEKMGGTIHLALGYGYPESLGRNESLIHCDLICDMRQGEILVDGEVLYRNGRFVEGS